MLFCVCFRWVLIMSSAVWMFSPPWHDEYFTAFLTKVACCIWIYSHEIDVRQVCTSLYFVLHWFIVCLTFPNINHLVAFRFLLQKEIRESREIVRTVLKRIFREFKNSWKFHRLTKCRKSMHCHEMLYLAEFQLIN